MQVQAVQVGIFAYSCSEKQLQEEQARREALRVEVDEMRKRAEDKEALLAMQARNNVETTP